MGKDIFNNVSAYSNVFIFMKIIISFLFSLQGRYTNRFQCPCQTSEKYNGNKIKVRNFISFTNGNKKREYCGRQLVGYLLIFYDIHTL